MEIISLEELQKVAKELNTVIGFKPDPIPEEGVSDVVLKNELIAVYDIIDFEIDKLSESTVLVLKQLVTGGEEYDRGTLMKKIEEVESTTKLGELKVVVLSWGEFASLRPSLASYTGLSGLKVLKVDMLEILERIKLTFPKEKEVSVSKSKGKPVSSSKKVLTFEALVSEIEKKKERWMTSAVDALLLKGGGYADLAAFVAASAAVRNNTEYGGCGVVKLAQHILAREKQGWVFKEEDGHIQLVGIS